ncbi:trigger factor [Flavobacterium columnare]|uniref:Trigger factor n=1 Tax=Flavobacterium columnare TaxID=996 RepID=A0AA94JQ17_9FLAO|nr:MULTISPECIES: trigger factor [Flavobacterium]MCH4829382.1 trigger factor [Flavobacterium columnare]MCH4834158.1 trigger factor [Flavobacterium columnare]OXA83050.1 trigger factor [Flavobacterium columnare] [Flavobacterium columnare NBRC 100251 = ATCC 23463]QYS91658.1 trigger factor [Flavobacterium covae]
MNITKTNIDALNAVVTVEVAKNDYAEKVEKVLQNYRKNANIPGFRKGQVPMSLVQKQYGKAVLAEEVNKLIQESLNKFLVEEKLDILGNPLPKFTEDFNWDADDFKFEFELGLAPEFDVKLEGSEDLTYYNIVADDKLLDEQVIRIQKQFGKMSSKDVIAKEDDIRGVFVNEEKGINKPAQITLDIFENKVVAESFIGKKAGDIVAIPTKGLFNDDHKLMDYLGLGHDDVHGLDITVDFKIEEVTTTEPAELNQELFDKLFGEGNVTSVEDLKAKIKEDAEKTFAQQADQKFYNDATEYLIKNHQVELPTEFLKRWIQTVGETPLTAEQAEVEYARSENGLRYQLIESKIITSNNLQVTFEDLKTYASDIIKKQMAQFGQLDPSQEDVDNIVNRVMTNQEEVRRLSEQVMSERLLNVFKEKLNTSTKEVTYDEFVKAMYGEI